MKNFLLIPLLLLLTNFGLYAQCSADFTPNIFGSTVYFQNNSNPTFGTYYIWNFGDGSHQNYQQHPSHTFPDTGTFNVRLQVWDSLNNCIDTIVKPVTIGCLANFSYSIQGYTVNFTSLAKAISPISSYGWSFGDMNTSTQQNPIHTYSGPGTYYVNFGFQTANCFDSLTIAVNIPPFVACQADFNHSVNGNTVTFTNQSTNLPANVSYHWNFGDGIVSTQANPVHNYSSPGTYTALLVITGTNCGDSISKQVVIVPQNCNANFNHSVNGYTVNFTQSSTNLPSNPVYYWNFGDGHTSNQANPVHQYNGPGTYNVIFAISGGTCLDTILKQVVVAPIPCFANFTFAVNDYSVSFTNTSTGDTANLNYEWHFGDNHTSTQKNPVHQYTANGTYNVMLHVYNNHCGDSITKQVVVNVPPPPCNATFTYSMQNDSSVSFTNNSASPANTTYQWYFGDGHSSTQTNPSHVYNNVGQYTVTLVINGPQCIDSIMQTIYIFSNKQCQANFTYAKSGNTVIFQHNSTGALSSTRYLWTFGTGDSSINEFPVYVYNHPGTFSVCLQMIDSTLYCKTQFCTNITIDSSWNNSSISGTVNVGTTTADFATVWLIVYDSIQGTLAAIDSTTTIQGNYAFGSIPSGYYLIKAALNNVSAHYNNYMPTYYTNELTWSNANLLLVNGVHTGRNIDMISGNNPGGPGFIGGLVSQGANKNNAPGAPMNGVFVYLLDLNDNPIAHTRSDADGRFEFTNIAYGTYIVYAEIEGKTTIPGTVTIDANNPEVDVIDIRVNSNTVIVSNPTSVNHTLRDLYSIKPLIPNPAREFSRIDFNLPTPGQTIVHVTDLTGKTLIQQSEYSSGNTSFSIDVSGLKEGMYFVSLIVDGKMVNTQKLIRY